MVRNWEGLGEGKRVGGKDAIRMRSIDYKQGNHWLSNTV